MKTKSVYPVPLKAGDTIAILAPAGIVRRDFTEDAARFLREAGFVVRILDSAVSSGIGSYSAPVAQRIEEFKSVWGDNDVKCVLCARGGYGCVHLLESLNDIEISQHPKWVIGFSDVSALHALMNRHGVVSVHGPMCKHIATRGNDAATQSLLSILNGSTEIVTKGPADAYNRPGKGEGKLVGGNLAVLNSLAGTGYDLLSEPLGEDCILFIEDISEAIYAVERMLYRLQLGGVLKRVKGLIVGEFTDYRADRNYDTMEAMIDARLREWGVTEMPVAFHFPVGHIECNMPLMIGSRARLEVTGEQSVLTQRI